MDSISVLLIAVLSVAAAVYTQYRLPFLTATRNQAGWARAILMIAGIAFGLVAVKQIGNHESSGMLLIFLAAWGLVHVPAAIILFLKQQQRNNP